MANIYGPVASAHQQHRRLTRPYSPKSKRWVYGRRRGQTFTLFRIAESARVRPTYTDPLHSPTSHTAATRGLIRGKLEIKSSDADGASSQHSLTMLTAQEHGRHIRTCRIRPPATPPPHPALFAENWKSSRRTPMEPAVNIRSLC